MALSKCIYNLSHDHNSQLMNPNIINTDLTPFFLEMAQNHHVSLYISSNWFWLFVFPLNDFCVTSLNIWTINEMSTFNICTGNNGVTVRLAFSRLIVSHLSLKEEPAGGVDAVRAVGASSEYHRIHLLTTSAFESRWPRRRQTPALLKKDTGNLRCKRSRQSGRTASPEEGGNRGRDFREHVWWVNLWLLLLRG